MTTGGGGTAGVTVVATTTQAADLARAVAGDRAEVVGLLPANADPHDYEIRPDDVKALARAELVVRSGGELDEWLGPAIESSGTDAPTLSLIDHVDTRERDGDVDPHWWQDPRNAVRAVAAIEAALTRADPGGAAAYAGRPRVQRPDRTRSTPPWRTASGGSRPASASWSRRTTRWATTPRATASR